MLYEQSIAPKRVIRSLGLFCLTALVLVTSTHAHEYWLDPIDSAINLGERAIIDIRNGENFSGAAFGYDPKNYQRVQVSNAKETVPYEGRLGDYPALHPRLMQSGLYSISLDTTATLLTYKTWEKFNNFLSYHGFDTAREYHITNALPTTDIKERYYRSAKTIVQVHNSKDTSAEINANQQENANVFAPVDSLFEMVLLNNPLSNVNSVRVQLLFEGQPLSGRQTEIFWQGSQLIRRTQISDENGIATFKLLGKGNYLLNAVQLVAPPANADIDWLSYWASITFERQ